MRIQWYGHAAFRIETAGLAIILDPYRSPDCGGYEPIDDPADLVIVSHENDRYHSHLGQIRPPFEVVRCLELPDEEVDLRGVAVKAVRVFETPEKRPGDEVAVLRLRAEGLTVVFLGDLGHALSAAELDPLRGADVVLAAAGGPPTIDFPEIPPLLGAIGPRVVIPMHFKTPKIDLNIQPLVRFLDCLPGVPVRHPGISAIEVDRESLPDVMTVVCLEHAR